VKILHIPGYIWNDKNLTRALGLCALPGIIARSLFVSVTIGCGFGSVPIANLIANFACNKISVAFAD